MPTYYTVVTVVTFVTVVTLVTVVTVVTVETVVTVKIVTKVIIIFFFSSFFLSLKLCQSSNMQPHLSCEKTQKLKL